MILINASLRENCFIWCHSNNFIEYCFISSNPSNVSSNPSNVSSN